VDSAFRTSSAGIFAAGNLLHGAEAADRAALEGRACAAAVARFLEHDVPWRDAPLVPVEAAPPLRWIVPSVLGASGPAGTFVTRVGAFLGRGALEVRQDGRLLHRARFLSLVPNRSVRLPGRWTAHVRRDGGPVVVSAVARSREE
jgi:hypothetical protein